MALTIINQIGTDGTDTLYIRGADIVDPANNENTTVDESGDETEWVYTVTVEAAEDEKPYRDALAELGITVTGRNADGDWTGEQSRPLPL